MASLSWTFSLFDRFSDPASKIEKRLGEVRGALKMLDMQSKQSRLDRVVDPLKRTRLELQIQRDKLLMSRAALGEHGRASARAGVQSKSFLDQLTRFSVLGYTVGSGLGFMARQFEDFGARVVKAVSFRETAMIGLTTFATSAGEARDIFEQLSALSGRIGRPVEELVGMGRALQNIGEQADFIVPTVKLFSDLGAMQGLDKAQTGFSAYTKALSDRLFTMRSLREFKGIIGKNGQDSDSLILRHMMEATGFKDRGSFTAAAEAGQIGSSVLGYAVRRSILDMEGGTLGKKSGQYGGTLEGILNRFQSRIERLFGGLADRPGFKVFKQVMENLLAVISSPKMAKTLGGWIDQLGESLKPLTGPDGRKRMIAFFDSMSQGVEKVMPGLRAMTALLGWAAGKTTKSISGLGMLADIGSDFAGFANGQTPSTTTGRDFLSAFYGDAPPGVPVASSWRAPMLAPQVTVTQNISFMQPNLTQAQITQAIQDATHAGMVNAFDSVSAQMGSGQ